MPNTMQAILVEAQRYADGWEVKVVLDPAVKILCTLEEQAHLLEKLACEAAADASHLRQQICREGK